MLWLWPGREPLNDLGPGNPEPFGGSLPGFLVSTTTEGRDLQRKPLPAYPFDAVPNAIRR
jgi:hypothetical protein